MFFLLWLFLFLRSHKLWVATVCSPSPVLSAGVALVKRSKGISDSHKYCCVTGAIGRRHQNIRPQSITLRRITASKLIRHLAQSNIRSLGRMPAVTWHAWPRQQLARAAFSSLVSGAVRLVQFYTVTLPHVEYVQLRHISDSLCSSSCCWCL